jgi:hypothetical protein
MGKTVQEGKLSCLSYPGPGPLRHVGIVGMQPPQGVGATGWYGTNRTRRTAGTLPRLVYVLPQGGTRPPLPFIGKKIGRAARQVVEPAPPELAPKKLALTVRSCQSNRLDETAEFCLSWHRYNKSYLNFLY